MMAGVYLRLLLIWVASSAHITTGDCVYNDIYIYIF